MKDKTRILINLVGFDQYDGAKTNTVARICQHSSIVFLQHEPSKLMIRCIKFEAGPKLNRPYASQTYIENSSVYGQ